MILPVLELQPGVPVGTKQAVSATAEDAKSSFSAAFDESLRVSSESESESQTVQSAQPHNASGLVLRAPATNSRLTESSEADGQGTKGNLAGGSAVVPAGSDKTQGPATSADAAAAVSTRTVSERFVAADVEPAGLNASLSAARSNLVKAETVETQELVGNETVESASTRTANGLGGKAVTQKSGLADASAPRTLEDVAEADLANRAGAGERARSAGLTVVPLEDAASTGAVAEASKLETNAGKGLTVKAAASKALSARESPTGTVSNGTPVASSIPVSVSTGVKAQRALPDLAAQEAVAQASAPTGAQAAAQTITQTASRGVTETPDGKIVRTLGVRSTAISVTKAQGTKASTTLSPASLLIGKAAVEPQANRQSGEAVKAQAATESSTSGQTIYQVGRTVEGTDATGSSAKQDELAGSSSASVGGTETAALVGLQGTTSTARASSDADSAIKSAQTDSGSYKARANAASSDAQLKSSAEWAAAKTSGAAYGSETLVSPSIVSPNAGAHLPANDGVQSPSSAAPTVSSHTIGRVAGASMQSATKPPLRTAAATSTQQRTVTGDHAIVADLDDKALAAGSALRPAVEQTVDTNPSHLGRSVSGRSETSESAFPSPGVTTDTLAHDSARGAAAVAVSAPGPAPSVATANHAVNAVAATVSPAGLSSAAETSAGAGSAAAISHPAVAQMGASAAAGMVSGAALREVPTGAASSSTHGGGVAGATGTLTEGVEGRTNAAAISEPHRTLMATPTTLEVGVPDGTQGWLRIRAQVGDQGQVSAALTAPSGASQDMLHRELPALNTFLHSEQMAVTATVSERSFAGAGPVLAGADDGSRRSSTEGGMAQGNMAGGGQTDGRQGDAGPQEAATRADSTLAIDAGRGYSSSAGLSEAVSANSALSGDVGQWLNVQA